MILLHAQKIFSFVSQKDVKHQNTVEKMKNSGIDF